MATTQCMVRPDGVAVITLDNPPVNSLASGLVKSFNENLAKVSKDPAVKAVVVTGKVSTANYMMSGSGIKLCFGIYVMHKLHDTTLPSRA